MIDKGASLSPCGRYRYTLWRRWGAGTTCIFIGLNPSTADASVDDPTVCRCIDFARRWRHGSLVMLNLYAWRDTSPKALFNAQSVGRCDIIGPGNDHRLRHYTMAQSHVIAAWGANAPIDRVRDVLRLMVGVQLQCLGYNKSGSPKHPLYVRADTALQPWTLWELQ